MRELLIKFTFISFTLAALALLFIWKKRNTLTAGRCCFTLGLLGFSFRLSYVLFLSATQWQHDVGAFNTSDAGHAGYILYLYNNFFLPDFDVSQHGQFYHPPLHHFLCAVWMRLQTFLGVSLNRAIENIQVLTLAYSTACMVISYKIFNELKLKRTGIICAFSIIAFHPSFFILSSSINNDILCIMLMLLCALYTIKWYNNPSTAGIIKIALALGFSMMTKLSGGYMAIPVGIIFLIKLGKEKNIRQYVFFGAVCVPLGTWWSIRNLISHCVSPLYVPRLSEKSNQYLGNYGILRRFFDFSNFRNALTASGNWVYNQGVKLDYNIFLALFKTALYGEYMLGWNDGKCKVISYVHFFSSLLTAIAAFIVMMYYLKKAVQSQNIPELFIIIMYGALLLLYFVFCFTHPHNCTMDFRYIVPLLTVTSFFLGKAADDMKHKIIPPLCAVFCVSSCAFYFLGIL